MMITIYLPPFFTIFVLFFVPSSRYPAWNYELTAGNYIIRNTEFGRNFLNMWANFDYQVPRGFSSADNGAIHLAVLQAVGKVNMKCVDKYHALTAGVTNLNPYFDFVACTRAALGPSRRWVVENEVQAFRGRYSPLSGTVAILNRYHGFCVDHFIAHSKAK